MKFCHNAIIMINILKRKRVSKKAELHKGFRKIQKTVFTTNEARKYGVRVSDVKWNVFLNWDGIIANESARSR